MSEKGLKKINNGRLSLNNKNMHLENNRVVDTVVDNFGSILDLAYDITEICKMKVQSDAVINKMEQDRKTLLAEAEAYAIRKNVDTSSIIDKMKLVQEMMRDFYQYNNSNISSEDFSKIISEVINQMGNSK